MLLSAEHLSINFGSRQLLDDVNFYLNEGDKVGVIGINGTGKSTFLKVLSGVTEPDGGTISRNPNVQVSLLPQNPAMEESATVLEQVFLHFPAEFRELNEYEAKAMLNRLGITDFAQKVGTLSGGQRKRVALAAALIHPADVLILDDIQELIGKDKTQNTFFHIFNHLHLLGKQLILTSDKAPVDLQGMEERLITRLKWGLTAELDRPDLDLRKKILKNKISHDGVVIPDDVFNFIASNVTENVRDVEGIVASLLAYSTAFNRMIDLPLTKQVVSRVVKLEKKQVSVESIQDVVCKYYNLELAAIQTNSRKREIVQARQVTMYLAKKYTDSSFSHIGKIVGKRDHATVLHACKTVRDQIETNKSFRSSVEEIEALLKA